MLLTNQLAVLLGNKQRHPGCGTLKAAPLSLQSFLSACSGTRACVKATVCSLPEDQPEAPADLLGSEQYELYNCANMDDFFTRLYRCKPCRSEVVQPEETCIAISQLDCMSCSPSFQPCTRVAAQRNLISSDLRARLWQVP